MRTLHYIKYEIVILSVCVGLSPPLCFKSKYLAKNKLLIAWHMSNRTIQYRYERSLFSMNKCLFCGKEVLSKSRYCSEAHSKAYRRRTKAGHSPDKNDPQVGQKATRTLDFKPTRTDSLFEKSKPDYYKFDKDTFNRSCLVCGKAFRTHLKLLRFCSPTHQLNGLDNIVKTGKVR